MMLSELIAAFRPLYWVLCGVFLASLGLASLGLVGAVGLVLWGTVDFTANFLLPFLYPDD